MKKLITVSFIVLILLLSLTITALAASGATDAAKSIQYTDLSADWYRSAVEKYGFPDIFADGTLFHPDKPITRIEFARMLHRALDITINYFAPTDITDHFSDMTNDDIGAGELYDLVTVGIIDKNLKGKFGPDQPLSREEMIHYIMNALRYVTDGNYPIILIMPAPFADDASIDDAYRNDIIQAVILKLIQGRGNNMLYPKESATRAEAAVVVDRLMELKRRLVPDVKVTPSAVVNNGTLEMRLTIENTGDTAVTINHSSGQKYDFKVLDNTGEILYTWSADKLFIALMTATEIKPGEKIEFSEVLGSEIFEPIKDKAAFVTAYIVGSSDDFDINPDGYVTSIS